VKKLLNYIDPTQYISTHFGSTLHVRRCIIPRVSKAAGKVEPAPENTEKQQAGIEQEQRCLGLEQELAALHAEMGKQKDAAERERQDAMREKEDLLKGYLDQLKAQALLMAQKIPTEIRQFAGASGTPGRSGYVAELVSYQALKRVSQEILRKLTVIDGLSKDARILITGEMNYIGGDMPLIEISQQFAMFETRSRKQVADNRELLDWVMQREEGSEAEGPSLQKEASRRFAFLATVPAIAAASTALPAFPGLTGTVAGIGGTFSPDDTDHIRRKVVSIQDSALAAAIAGALRLEKKNVFIYNFSSLDTIGSQSKLIKTYAGLLDSSSRLAKTRNQLSFFVDKKREKLAEFRTIAKKLELVENPTAAMTAELDMLKEKIREESSWLNLAPPAILASDAMHEELAAYLARITTAGTPDSLPALAQAVFREKVQDLGITHLLFLGVHSAGGEVVTKRSLFIFKSISYFGGCVASYILARKEGEILVSDTLPVLCVVDFRLFDNWIGPLLQVRFERPELRK